MISLIAALTLNHVIGIKNVIPWYFSMDMQWFRYHTLNKSVIMGRKTFESLGSKPLLNRFNIILSRYMNNYNNSHIVVVNNPKQALLIAQKYSNEVMIIGGSEVYEFFLPQSQRLYLTYINVIINGDIYFPYFNYCKWRLVFNKFCIVYEECKFILNFKIFERF